MAEAEMEEIMFDIDLITPDTDVDMNKATWHAVLVVEGVRTSDGREFSPGSIRWRTLPIPLMWQMASDERHKGSVVVGRIDRIERVENEIHGWGTFDLGSDHGREAHRLVSEQIMRGVSVDAELLEIDKEMLLGGEDGDVVLLVEEGRLLGATIVAFPAFPQAVIALDNTILPPATEDGRAESLPEPASVVSSETADDEFRHHADIFTITDRAWDSSSSRFTDAQYKRASAGCRGSDALPKSECFLVHHEPDGAVNRNAVHNAASRFNQTQAPAADLIRARNHLANHYRRDLKEDPPKVLMALSLVAHADIEGPPADWFSDPELKGPTPLTIARNGRVYGHAALFDACHTGYKTCMRPPRSRSNYAYFLTGTVFASGCDCETGIPTGPITLGTTHADAYSAPDTARRHYDNTGQAVADVASGEDSYGIWIAGALRPGVTEAQIRALRGSALSGDWRYIAGNMELISLLAVNTPGFPIPRVAAAVDQGIQVSLTAAGISDDAPTPGESGVSGSKPADLLEELKREKEAKAKEEDEDEVVEPEQGEADEDGKTESAEPSDTVDPALDSVDASEPEIPIDPALSSVPASQLLTELKAQ